MSGIDDCLQQAMAIPGATGASLVDCTSGFALGAAGAAPASDPDATAAGTAEVVYSATSKAPFISDRPGDLIEDIIIATAYGYHLIRPVRTTFDGRLVLYLWLDGEQGNLAIARRRLRAIAEDLVPV